MTGLPAHLTIVSLTQHWRSLHGTWYRDAWVRNTTTGGLEFVAILDDVL